MGDDDAGKRAVRRGWYVLRGIRGHTKKLNPLARQVRRPGGPRRACRLPSHTAAPRTPTAPTHPTTHPPTHPQIVGKSASEVLAQMSYSKQSRARNVKVAVERALLNADFYHALRPEQMLVERAWTGKHLTSMRIRHHSKGRAGRSHWRTSMLTVRVREMEGDEPARLNKFTRLPAAATRTALDPRGY